MHFYDSLMREFRKVGEEAEKPSRDISEGYSDAVHKLQKQTAASKEKLLEKTPKHSPRKGKPQL